MSNPPKTRVSLILRLQQQEDVEAWEEFVEIYQPLVYRLAIRKGLQPADALDTTQEVLTRVAKAINRWNPDPEKGTFRGWLSTITRNLVVEFLRVKNRRPLTSDNSAIDEFIRSAPDKSQESLAFELEEKRQIFAWAAEKIRGEFKPGTWQAFWKTAVENVPVAAVAAKLEMTKGAVYIARSRVMAKLKSQIQQYVSNESTDASQKEIVNTFSNEGIDDE